MKSISVLILSVFLLCFTACVKEDPPAVKKLSASVSVVFPKVESDEDSNSDTNYGSVIDIDGNIYKTIKIGSQEWMTSNLKVTRYNNNSQSFYEKNSHRVDFPHWFDLETGAYCWYDNDPDKYKNLGALYNWEAVGSGKLCPTGWHVPDCDDWTQLVNSLGGVADPFNKLSGVALVSGITEDRIIESGFNPGLGGCYIGPKNFIVPDASLVYCYWWAAASYLEYNVPFTFIFSFSFFINVPQTYGFNVRCVKD